ncbi:MAG: hypothetical protein KA746_09325 [Pyrinomonadaceae bacterium]|nr:hypothetical protein [Pyrinomonadaceae bacterium]MBP6213246.1 hypothetical protein [Pyrinomonadaceae bacterium]
MRKFIQFISLATLAIGIAVTSAFAQSDTTITVEIPHDFSVGDRSFDSGSYDIRISKNSAGGASVTLIDADGKRLNTVVAMANSTAADAKPELIFERDGSDRVLSAIVLANSGVSIPNAGLKKRLRVREGTSRANN